MFKESFKYYKAKWPVPDFAEVIDFDGNCPAATVHQLELNSGLINEICDLPPGLQPVHTWRCYSLAQQVPGLLVIRNPFTTQGQRYWIARCLRDFPRQPNRVNLNSHLFSSSVLEDWWRELQQCNDKDEARRMKVSMRWCTLGYHHNWDTKVYSEQQRGVFPNDLAKMCQFFARMLGFADFSAQAAIVNFYPLGTTLAGHTDHSEMNLEAPLFSFSFGQTAIFLIGGRSREEKPIALYLQSGDVLVMSSESRLCYHAVPRIMKARIEPWNEHTQTEQENCIVPLRQHKKQRIEYTDQPNTMNMDMLLYQQLADDLFWSPFKSYLNDARINVNVRQVLHAGEETLTQSDDSISI